MAGIEGDAQAFDVVAEHDGGIGILGHASALGQEADANAVLRRYGGQFAEPFDFGVKGRTQLGRTDGKGHDFNRLGQLAAGGKLAVVEGFRGFDVDAEGNGGQAMGLAAERYGSFEIVQHGGGLHVSARLVDHEFHTGVLQIGELHQGGIQG